ncbi:MAG: type II toxin-antitoxin system VapC family toxin [Gammaproteobacteria bacterium]
MNLVLDTSAVIAVITNESHKKRLVEVTTGADLIAPSSVPAEIGNAFSAMFKQKRIGLEQALAAIESFQAIPIRVSEIDLAKGLELADQLGVYAYDAYVIACALRHRCPLISLDNGLNDAARRAGAQIVEVER